MLGVLTGKKKLRRVNIKLPRKVMQKKMTCLIQDIKESSGYSVGLKLMKGADSLILTKFSTFLIPL